MVFHFDKKWLNTKQLSVYIALLLVANALLIYRVNLISGKKEGFWSKVKKPVDKTIKKATKPIESGFKKSISGLTKVVDKVKDGLDAIPSMIVNTIFKAPVDAIPIKRVRDFFYSQVNYKKDLGTVVKQTGVAIVNAIFIILVMIPLLVIMLQPVVVMALNTIMGLLMSLFASLFKSGASAAQRRMPKGTNISQLKEIIPPGKNPFKGKSNLNIPTLNGKIMPQIPTLNGKIVPQVSGTPVLNGKVMPQYSAPSSTPSVPPAIPTLNGKIVQNIPKMPQIPTIDVGVLKPPPS